MSTMGRYRLEKGWKTVKFFKEKVSSEGDLGEKF